jgi:stearoyl-CoA desaturase (delta-9 desaturase)
MEFIMRNSLAVISRWIVNDNKGIDLNQPDKIDWLRAVPFMLMNLACLLVFWLGVSPIAVEVAAAFYFIRIFSIGAFYHRYFSHRTFKTNRFWQFIFAIMAMSSAQRGPIWWASHHRNHHSTADQERDAHSPVQHGFWWSHIGWFLSKRNYSYDSTYVKDILRYPEIVFLDRFDILVPLAVIGGMFALGALLPASMHTNGLQMVLWGFCISTVLVFHTTASINSLAHQFGKRRYNTKDDSRNNVWLALITFGEGWHNNHHHYPSTAQQGFYWWEVDLTFYMLRLLQKLGIIWDLRTVPKEIVAHRD